ncbi:hypothetical protein K2X30_08130 [bacterium]|nr:hypothetical protein [bacterium]
MRAGLKNTSVYALIGGAILALSLSGCTLQLINARCSSKSPLSLSNPASLELWTGDAFDLLPDGGCPDYSAWDQGSGYLDTSSLHYSVGLQAAPGSETVTIADRTGRQASLQVQWRAFQSQAAVSGGSTMTSLLPNFRKVMESGSVLYGIGRRQLTLPTVAVAITMASSDGGNSWSYLDEYAYAPGMNSYGIAIDARGTQLLGLVQGTRWGGDAASVRYSTDSGATWETLLTITDPDYGFTPSDIKFVTNDVFLIAGARYAQATNYSDWSIFRCLISTGSCSVTDFIAGGSNNSSVASKLAVDSNGIVYVGGRVATGVTDNSLLRKSTDQGQSFSTIGTQSFGGSVEVTEVSADGATILWSGSWVRSPWVFYSFDSGSNWSADQTGAASLWRYYDVKILANRDLIASGYCFSDCGAGMRWVANRRSFATGTWTNTTPAVAGDSGRLLALRSNGDLIAFNATGLLISTNSGTSYSALPALSGLTMATSRLYTALTLGGSGSVRYMTSYSMDPSTGQSGQVLISNDSGQTWSNDLQLGGNTPLFNIGRSPTTGTIVVGGSNVSTTWIGHRNVGGLGVWQQVLNAAPAGASGGQVMKVRATSNGDFFLTGTSTVTGIPRWFVLHSTDDAATWSTSETYTYPGGNGQGSASAAGAFNTGLAVAGGSYDASGVMHWVVRLWNGTSWSTIDDFVYSGMTMNSPKEVLQVGADLYVVGQVYPSNNLNSRSRWIVRKYSSGVWSTVDDYQLASNAPSAAMSITELSSGTSGSVVVAGSAVDANGIQRATLRRWNGTSWNTVDSYTPYGGSVYNTIVECSSGVPCAAGFSNYDTSGNIKSLFRVLSP